MLERQGNASLRGWSGTFRRKVEGNATPHLACSSGPMSSEPLGAVFSDCDGAYRLICGLISPRLAPLAETPDAILDVIDGGFQTKIALGL